MTERADLTDLIARVEAAEAGAAKAEARMIEWRAAFQDLTPGGSEFMSPDAVRAFARDYKDRYHKSMVRAVRAEQRVAMLEGLLREAQRYAAILPEEDPPGSDRLGLLARIDAALNPETR